MNAFRRGTTALPLLLIRVYRIAISPVLPPACRFEPTCSEYFAEALRSLGLLRGSWLGVRRILRCRPFGGRGYDPVPLPGKSDPGPLRDATPPPSGTRRRTAPSRRES